MIKLELTPEEAREVVNAIEEREANLLDKTRIDLLKANLLAGVLLRTKLQLLPYEQQRR